MRTNITLNNVIMNSNFIKLQMTDRPINQSNFIFNTFQGRMP